MENEVSEIVRRLLWTAENDDSVFDAETARKAAQIIMQLSDMLKKEGK